MKISVIATSSQEQIITREQALNFGGKAAGICYMANTLQDILKEPAKKTEARIRRTLYSGHHSVYEHMYFTIYLEGIPKILAMILNNENAYVTSEKSARYTTMKTSGDEEYLYNEWIDIFKTEIKSRYSFINDEKIAKLAKENARYLISVFTPSTNMLYTTSFRQINYILHWCEDYIDEESDNDFTIKVKEVLKDFITRLKWIYVTALTIKPKTKKLSLFDEQKVHNEQFGECYCTTYKGSMAQLGQAQRHRTISYKMRFGEEEYYVPPILEGTFYEEIWLQDIAKLGKNFPQGRLVTICERGKYEDFILKCEERLCGQAQLEIMNQTYETLNKYIKNCKDKDIAVFEALQPYAKGVRCNLPYWKCTNPCPFGKNAIHRKI